MPGCEVLVRQLVGKHEPNPICKWHQQDRAYNDDKKIPVKPDDGKLLSLDEFGKDLFMAIKVNSARIQAMKKAQIQQQAGKPYAARESQEHADALQKELELLLPKISDPDDLRRILAME